MTMTRFLKENVEMRYEITEVPDDEIFRILSARFPDAPPEKLEMACKATAAVFNIVFWCEVNEMPIRYGEMLEITENNTNLRGAKLSIATAAATKAANLAFEEKRQLLSLRAIAKEG